MRSVLITTEKYQRVYCLEEVYNMDYDEMKSVAEESNMFFEKEKGGFHLFSYHYFDPEEYREHLPYSKDMRGIVFDKNKNIVSLPFPKFFNFIEEDCDIKDESKKVVTTNKLDGSLLVVSIYDNDLLLSSKGSMGSWVIHEAMELIKEKHKNMLKNNKEHTFMFEYINPKKNPVLCYNDRKLVIVGMRNKNTGEIINPKTAFDTAEKYKIEHAEIIHDKARISEVREDIKGKEGAEGIVGYRKGKLMKIKTKWYLERHKILSKLTDDKIRGLYFHEKLDDYRHLFSEDMEEKADKIAQESNEELNELIERVKGVFDNNEFDTRKNLALFLQDSDIDKPKHNIFYQVFEGEDVPKVVFEYFKDKYPLKEL